MKTHRVYVVGQFGQNSQTSCSSNGNPNHPYCSFLREECDHTHTTISGAARCLRRLSKFWADGSHNEWAHFGSIVPLKPCGHPDSLTQDEDTKLMDIEYEREQFSRPRGC